MSESLSRVVGHAFFFTRPTDASTHSLTLTTVSATFSAVFAFFLIYYSTILLHASSLTLAHRTLPPTYHRSSFSAQGLRLHFLSIQTWYAHIFLYRRLSPLLANEITLIPAVDAFICILRLTPCLRLLCTPWWSTRTSDWLYTPSRLSRRSCTPGSPCPRTLSNRTTGQPFLWRQMHLQRRLRDLRRLF